MAVKKAKVNHYNGSSYDTLHYETQSSQVKVLNDSGSNYAELEEMLYKGKVIEGASLNTLILHGVYKIKNCTNMPSGVSATKYLLLIVHSVLDGTNRIIKQEVVDYDTSSTYVRIIEKGKIGKWSSAGGVIDAEISSINKDIGSLSSLKTSAKGSLVNAINENKIGLDGLSNTVSSNKKDFDTLKKTYDSHNHDKDYLKLTGGSVEGNVAIKNNSGLQGKTNSGTAVDLAKINTKNESRLGHSSLSTIIASKGGDLKVSDGSKLYQIFHAGNMGKGSGLDADKLIGVSGSDFVRKDTSNTLRDTVVINDGNFYMDRVSGGKTASVFFRYDKSQTGRIYATTAGDLRLYGGSKLGLVVKSNGWTETTYPMSLNAKDRNVNVRFKRSNSDVGRGLHLNNTTTNRFGLYDWGLQGWYFYSEKGSREVRFPAPIAIQGHQVFIQSGSPSKPSNGDIWFKL